MHFKYSRFGGLFYGCSAYPAGCTGSRKADRTHPGPAGAIVCLKAKVGSELYECMEEYKKKGELPPFTVPIVKVVS